MKENNTSGFTLVELMVSIGIIVLMTGIFLSSYHSNNRKNSLDAAAQILASNIRLSQSYSLGSKKYGSASPAGGWGLSLNNFSTSNTYYRFYTFNSGNNPVSEFKRIKLPKNIIIKDFSLMKSDGNIFDNKNDARINFEPPDPITHINSTGITDAVWLKINLMDIESNLVATVFVNFYGMIEVLK